MKLLALDSSGLVAGAALLEDDLVIAEFNTQYRKTHSQTLLPMIDQITRMTDLDLQTLDAIALAAGPGSFTGLRIGAATAKGLGFALGKPLVAVPTLEGLAYNLYGTNRLVCPILDARRNQVYTGIYEFRRTQEDAGGEVLRLFTHREQCALSIEEIAEEINSLDRETLFLGDGVPVFAGKLSELLRVPYGFAPPHMSRQRAASVGALGMVYYREGRIQTAEEHTPIYLRLSQAERERMEAAHRREKE